MSKKTLTKAVIVEAIYGKVANFRTIAEVKNVVGTLLRLMKQGILKDNALLLSGFGKFEAIQKHARRGRNPHTSEAITLKPRRVVLFRLSKKFRAALNQGKD